MGWTDVGLDSDCSDYCGTRPDIGKMLSVPMYSTKLEDGWKVVEQMRQRGFSFSITCCPFISSVQSGYVASFVQSVYPPDRRDSAVFGAGSQCPAEAICQAALLAVKGETSGE